MDEKKYYNFGVAALKSWLESVEVGKDQTDGKEASNLKDMKLTTKELLSNYLPGRYACK